jgi:predicted ATPase
MNELFAEWLNQIFQGLAIIIGLFVAALVRQAVESAREYLSVKTGLEKTELIKELSFNVVRALEQSNLYLLLDGEQKKERALAELELLTKRYNLNVDFDTLDRMIEAAVQVMNAEIQKDVWIGEYFGVEEDED